MAKELGSRRLQRGSRGFVHMRGDMPVIGSLDAGLQSSCGVEVS